MFDIGFWELFLIGVVALLVIGPERLPGLARKAGLWLGRGRRFVSQVKADIDREIAADELRRVLKEQADSSGVHEILEETRGVVDETRSSLDESRREVEQGAAEMERAEQEYLVKARPGAESRSDPKSPDSDPASGAQPSSDEQDKK